MQVVDSKELHWHIAQPRSHAILTVVNLHVPAYDKRVKGVSTHTLLLLTK